MFETAGGDDTPIIDRQKKASMTSFLQPILDKELTVEDIDNYAFVAVDGLVSLVNQKVDEYKAAHGTAGWDDKTIEDRALEFYGLEDVGTYLDFLDKKDEEIRNLDRVFKRMVHQNQVIIPPDETGLAMVENGNGKKMEDKKIINRTKAVLFILKEDFDIDVDNEEQLTMIDGVVRSNMMRDTSYVLIKTPMIKRTILVCDEKGNASYVLNNEVLERQNISDEELVDATKTDLNTLITETPELGKRVVYSKTGFVPRMIDAIKHPESTRPDEVTDKMKNTGKYLYPEAKEGELSLKGLAGKLGGVSSDTLSKLVRQIGSEELGKVRKRRFRTAVTEAYTPEQQAIIIEKGEQLGFIASPPEEGELSVRSLSRKLGGMNRNTLSKLIRQIGSEELGVIKKRKFGTMVTEAYTPEQQAIIIEKVKEQGLFTSPAKEGELSLKGLAGKLGGISRDTLSKLVRQIGSEELGVIKKRKFRARITEAYTPEQQVIIERYVDDWRKNKR